MENELTCDEPEASPTIPAREVLRAIGDRFRANRAKNVLTAYSTLRDDLAQNMANLSPEVISLGDLIAKLMSLEDFLRTTKNAGGDSGKPPIEHIAEFLSEPMEAHGDFGQNPVQ